VGSRVAYRKKIAYHTQFNLGDDEPFLAMLEAYIDDSGNLEGNRTYVLAAFCTTSREWANILRDWRGIVRHYGVTRFHATDCTNGYGEFQGWSGSKKGRLFRSTMDILARHTNARGYSVGIVLDDYNQVVEKDSQIDQLFGGPRSLVFQVLIQDIAKDRHGPIAFVMDRPNKGWGQLDELFEKTKQMGRPWCDNLHSLTPGNATRCPGIQTADLLAYETYRHLNQTTNKEPKRRPRKSLRRLVVEKSLSGKGAYLERFSLLRLIEECIKSGQLEM
jgi:Protein of unknown function (DUF3800)